MNIEKQKTTITILYGFLIASTILSFVPIVSMQVLSLALIATTLIVAYIYKLKGDAEDGILSNHMTYMIGTIWIAGSFLVIGVLAAAAIVYLKGDHTIVNNAMAQMTTGYFFTEEELKSKMMDYMVENEKILILASLPTLSPAILYFIYRIANGYGRAMKGYRIAKPKTWL